ncbi:peroxiredoxin-like family protein, partial [Thermodesulfobacteriota bacterium]
ARDLFDNPVSLEDYRGKRLMLSFYRYASCPLCNLRIHELIKNHDPLKDRGLSMLAVFQSPAESILEYVGRQDIPFPVIPDPDRSLYHAYGVESSWGAFLKAAARLPEMIAATRAGFRPGRMEGETAMVPADFLVGPDLVVEKAYYGKDIGDHIPIADVEAWLNKS